MIGIGEQVQWISPTQDSALVAKIVDVHLHRAALSPEGKPRLDLLVCGIFEQSVPHQSHGEGGSYWREIAQQAEERKPAKKGRAA